MVVRPLGPRLVAYGVAAILIILTVVIAMALPAEIRDQFTTLELLTLAGLLAAVLAGLHAVTRSFVRIEAGGLFVRNGYRDHAFNWIDLHGVSFRSGAPWPTLVTTDGERVIIFAIQGTDGAAAQAAVVEIRKYLS